MGRLKLIIVGAGGLGREASQYASDSLPSDEFEIIGYLDDDPDAGKAAGISLRYPHLGSIASASIQENHRFVMALGDPRARATVTYQLREAGARFVTIVHPLAYVARSASVGHGCIIAPFATVGAGARLGEFTHLHFYASAAHDTRIGSYVSLSPYAVANGQVQLGDQVFVGTHATINPTKRVGESARITAGSVVYRDVPAGSIAAGNPAKTRVLAGFGGA